MLKVVDGGDLAFDRVEMPLQPAGWQPEEDDVDHLANRTGYR